MKLFFKPDSKKLGDFEIVKKNGKFYCIFIEAPEIENPPKGEIENCYGLAESNDGIFWKYIGTIIKPPETGWNNGSLWAMSIVKNTDKWLLFYTALENKGQDPTNTQQIGFLWSNDLKNWNGLEREPVIKKTDTGNYYYATDSGTFCWRDPNIVKINDTYYCFIVAKDIEKEYNKSGCIAAFKSKDLENWKILPAIFSPGKYPEIETADLYKINDKWYVIYGEHIDRRNMRFAYSTNPLGEFEEPEDNIFTPSYCYAGRILKINGSYLFYYWIRDRFAKPSVNKTYLAPPKLIKIEKNHIFLKKIPGYEDFFKRTEEKDILSAIKKGERIHFSKSCSNDVEIIIDSKNNEYDRRIFLNKTKDLSIGDYRSDKKVNEFRTIPLELPDSFKLDIFIEDVFMEIYMNDYLVHSMIIENEIKNLESLSIKS